MGHSAGHLTDGLELLGLSQTLLELPLGGDVLEHSDQLAGLLVIVADQ